ncbi:MAG TPA: hypothetical protein VM681_00800 [Candidatus Thermoplasmatota archaeon]|nr:hypothetical protein [Candidatus Thermoplasmatota archaeon]
MLGTQSAEPSVEPPWKARHDAERLENLVRSAAQEMGSSLTVLRIETERLAADSPEAAERIERALARLEAICQACRAAVPDRGASTMLLG